MRIFLALYVFAIVATVSILGFRGSHSTKPPLEVFPDMDRQARYKPQAENEYFSDGRNDRPVPAKTVARGNYFNQADVFSAGFEDKTLGDTAFNQGKQADGTFVKTVPIEVSHELMAEGKVKYDIFCTVCHGAAGDGNGVTKPYGVLAAMTIVFAVLKMATSTTLSPTVRGSCFLWMVVFLPKNVGRLSSMFGHCSVHNTLTLRISPKHNAQS